LPGMSHYMFGVLIINTALVRWREIINYTALSNNVTP